MALYTSSYLRGLLKTKSLIEGTRMFSSGMKTLTAFDIFLSHSFLDKDEVEGLYIELTRLGYSVYVDWIIDPELDRNNITKKSATLIRNRLKSSKSLLLAVSVNATISKWMPWELGYVDGNTNKCAIIPVSQSDYAPNSYVGVEYLSLYPFIKKVSISGFKDELYVIEEARKFTTFNEWFKFGKQPEIKTYNIF